MMRKNNSRSFAQKQNFPATLPPLKKINKNADETPPNKNPCTTTRPVIFVIRKRNSSFMQSYTNRKGDSTKQNQMNRQISLNHPIKLEKKQQDQKREVLKPKDENRQMVSICSIQLQEFSKGKEIINYRRIYEQQKPNKISPLVIENRNASTQKNALKKGGKKRKIEECKIRKINWGSRNVFLDLGISAIKMNSQQESNTPIQSLHELYQQMF